MSAYLNSLHEEGTRQELFDQVALLYAENERLRAALEYITKFNEYEPAGPAARFAHLVLVEKAPAP